MEQQLHYTPQEKPLHYKMLNKLPAVQSNYIKLTFITIKNFIILRVAAHRQRGGLVSLKVPESIPLTTLLICSAQLDVQAALEEYCPVKSMG